MRDIAAMIKAGYEQLSRKYRTVARLPSGMNGYEALKRHDRYLANHFLEQAMRNCAREYMVRYAKNDQRNGLDTDLYVELTDEEFREWLGQRGCDPSRLKERG